MSHFLDRLNYFSNPKEPFSDDHGVTTGEDRTWEDAYRNRWAHDKIVRSTHGVNCTGSCSWKIYVKGGIVTWETQQTDYPRTRWDMPNHEPRGCARGASLQLVPVQREPRQVPDGARPAAQALARGAAGARPGRRLGVDRRGRREAPRLPERARPGRLRALELGRGQRDRRRGQRLHHQEVRPGPRHRLLADSGDVDGQLRRRQPLPEPDRRRVHELLRLVLRPAAVVSPQIWGEQTDVPESADWYNSSFIIAWGSNVPQTRTPDAHFFTEVRYKGTKTVAVTPDYSEVAKLADIWMHPKQGTDAAVAMAMGHVILKEFYFPDGGRERSAYFDDYVRRYTDMPMLVMLKEHTLPSGETVMVPDRYVRASDFNGKLGQANNPEWKTVAFDEAGKVVLPNGAIGFRWGPDGRADQGQWNLEAKEARHGHDVKLKLSVLEGESAEQRDREGRLPLLRRHRQRALPEQRAKGDSADVLVRTVPVQRIALGKEGEKREALVATVFDLQVANYGVARGLPGELAAKSFDDDTPYTPAWQERITGTPRAQVITVARQFAENAHKTQGRSMVIIGAAMNHWYHCDMNYRGIINMLMMCGCIGKSGGGWAHYVGQEKLRPQTGWTALAFALDWIRPPRQKNSTSFFYAHTDQWRYEKLEMDEVISPLADKKLYGGSMIDYNVRAERMGWLPSAPQLQTNPLQVVRDAQAAGIDPKEYAVKALKDGSLKMSCEDPDHPDNWPRNLFVWRSNLLGSSGKGHEYFLKHLLGTSNGVQGKDLGARGSQARGSGLARPGARGQARPAGDARLPHEHDVPVLGHRAADGDLVREERPQHQRHAPVHPSAVDRGGPGVAIAQRLGHLQGLREEVQRGLRRPPRRGARDRADAADARQPGRAGAAVRRQGLEARRDRPHSGQDGAADRGGRARLPERLQALHRARAADEQGRQRRQGHRLEHADRSEAAGRAQRRRQRRRRDPRHAADRDRHRRLRGDPAARARDQRPRRGQGVGGAVQADRAASTRTSRCTARTRRSASATSRRSRARSSARRRGAASRARPSRTTPATPTCTS